MSIRDWLWAMREMICGQSRRSPGGVYLARQVAGQHPLMQLEALPCRPYFQIQETLLLRRWKVWIKREKKGKRKNKEKKIGLRRCLGVWMREQGQITHWIMQGPNLNQATCFEFLFCFFLFFFGRPIGEIRVQIIEVVPWVVQITWRRASQLAAIF